MLRRPRRNRKSEAIRSSIRETHLGAQHMIMPLFLVGGENIKQEIPSLPMAYRWSLDKMMDEIGECMQLGIDKFIIFPAIPEELKNSTATYSHDPDNFYLHAATSIKEHYPEVCLISDVALDPYSSDGHDGLVSEGVILNDETLPILAKMAVAQAKAGFDIIGPSDMMDGRVEAIRMALDAQGFTNTSIMSYTAKYASALYGPFRDALDSAPKEGDKKTYQMDPANRHEALIEAQLDIEEGADFIMIKPALHYLDVIYELKNSFDVPTVAYHVSGECAMLHAACSNGWLDRRSMVAETLVSIRRAGADLVISYFAKEYTECIK